MALAEDVVGFGAGGLVVEVGGDVDRAGDGRGGGDVAGGAVGVGGEELPPVRVAEVAAQRRAEEVSWPPPRALSVDERPVVGRAGTTSMTPPSALEP